MAHSRRLVPVTTALPLLLIAACGTASGPTTPTPQVPTPEVATANVYILPGAVALGSGAFGDHPITIFKGERMRWRNVDGETHNLVADTTALPEFGTTGLLPPGDERSFIMNTTGSTRFHCTIHPQMVGTLVVQDR